jgi:putative transposase
VKLAAAHPHIAWPMLKRAGLTHPRKPRVRTPPYAQPFASVDPANQTWGADFKGWFRTADGTRCDPLTITDAHSAHVAAVFDACFCEHGLPLVIHTDHGAPFASRAPGGLSRVSMQGGETRHRAGTFAAASPQDNPRLNACIRR